MSLDVSRERDEAFWQQQEQRLQGCLGQPCCTLSGICSVLMSMAGRFAVVIHGERDCANSFHLHQGPAATNFFCTCLDERQVTTGQTTDPLRDCLEALVASRQRPEVIFVLGTCMIEMLGDRFEQTAEDIAQASGVTVRCLHTSGLRLGSQAQMLDWLFEELAGLPQVASADPAWIRAAAPLAEGLRRCGRKLPDCQRQHARLAELAAPQALDPRRSLNLVGLPEIFDRQRAEPFLVLSSIGLEVNGHYPFQATLDDWRAIGCARLSAVADRSIYTRLSARLEALGQQIVEVPLPVGLGQSERFYGRIAEAFELTSALDAELAQRRDRARAAIKSFSSRFKGIRMAMGIRMLNNYRADQLAYEGLGDAAALAELDLDLTLLVQGPPEQQARERFAARLAELGCELPFEVFPDPWDLSERLAAKGYDVAYLADHGREEAAKAGVPMIVSRGLKPYFAGIQENVQTLTQLILQSGVDR